jgi:hypothetical protein
MIFCKYCRFHVYWNVDAYSKHECYHPAAEIERHNELEEWLVHPECVELNRNNDCPLFEEKISLWRALCNSIRRIGDN